MVQARQGAGFPVEALGKTRVACCHRRQDLQRHQPVQGGLARPIDSAHTALADELKDFELRKQLGDVTDRLNLTPVAIHDAMCFARTVFGHKPTAPDHNLVATAMFSQPEIGAIGLTEEAARAKGHTIDIYKTNYRPLRHALSGRDERALMKLIVDAKTDRVLGCHIFAEEAAELVQLVAVAMKMGATKAQFDAAIAVHPTAAEELVTMRNKVVAGAYPKGANEAG